MLLEFYRHRYKSWYHNGIYRFFSTSVAAYGDIVDIECSENYKLKKKTKTETVESYPNNTTFYSFLIGKKIIGSNINNLKHIINTSLLSFNLVTPLTYTPTNIHFLYRLVHPLSHIGKRSFNGNMRSMLDITYENSDYWILSLKYQRRFIIWSIWEFRLFDIIWFLVYTYRLNLHISLYYHIGLANILNHGYMCNVTSKRFTPWVYSQYPRVFIHSNKVLSISSRKEIDHLIPEIVEW